MSQAVRDGLPRLVDLVGARSRPACGSATIPCKRLMNLMQTLERPLQDPVDAKANLRPWGPALFPAEGSRSERKRREANKGQSGTI